MRHVTGALFDLSPSVLSVVLFATGWVAGWFMLCRPRRLGRGRATPASISVIVPARDEEHSIGALASAVVAQLRGGDELIVVDDGSRDGTALVALAAGARVLNAPPPPPGWAGKPHACAVGAAEAHADALVFLDADVAPHATLLDDLRRELASCPDALVSVQPWHTPRGAVEQLSMLFNICALMGCVAFTALGRRVRTRVAFGAVMALRRTTYDAVGGHASPLVRAAILEDIALAREVTRTQLFVGDRNGPAFRMYPGGFASLVEGWTKGMGIGASATPWWALVATAAWVTSVAGGWLSSPWFAAASMLQLAVLSRVAGRFHPLAVVLYPIPTAFFVVVFVRSAIRRTRRATVTWKGRTLRPDQATG
jgi:4,4'-diaponeurosporenoate glycosyltransferase